MPLWVEDRDPTSVVDPWPECAKAISGQDPGRYHVPVGLGKRGKRHRLGGPYHGTPPILSRQVQGPPISSILPWVSLIAPPLLPERRASGLHSRPWGFPIAGLCVSDRGRATARVP